MEVGRDAGGMELSGALDQDPISGQDAGYLDTLGQG